MSKSVKKLKTTRAITTITNIMTQRNKFHNKTINNYITKHAEHKRKCRTLCQTALRTRQNFLFPTANSRNVYTHSSNYIVNRVRQQKSLWLMWWLLLTLIHNVQLFETTKTQTSTAQPSTSTSTIQYSRLLSTNDKMSKDGIVQNINDDTFRPFVPKDKELISRNVFTPSGQFRVFQPIDTDLRAASTIQRKSQHYQRNKMSEPLSISLSTIERQTSLNTQQMVEIHKNVKAHGRAVYQTNSSNFSQLKHQQQKNQHPVQHKTVSKIHDIKNNKNEHEQAQAQQYKQPTNILDVQPNEIYKQDDLTSDVKSLENLLEDYVTNFFEKGQYKPISGLLVELQSNRSQALPIEVTNNTRKVRQTVATDAKVSIDLPRTMATGRLLFLTGLKKVLWPVFVGLQVLKSLLIAMFIPALIGSFTKLLGKGISTSSAPLFIRPMEPPQELDFRDNSINFDEDNKFIVTDDGMKIHTPYTYNQPDASQMLNEYMIGPASTNNQLSYTRLGMNERQQQLMQDSYMSAVQSIGSASFKNSGSLSSSSSGLLAPMAKRPPPAAKVNNFQQFQNVPDSSLLLSNYDPFYSPLLSRLDSVFAQLKINSDKEICREKLICLMYANPAKYAPYSNLVSAQLSRELNELRKPTSDNPDILRFFKYMRAAKDGQDGIDCEKTFDKCTEFKDFENPAMVSTYHDINKLVQARKLTRK